MAKVTALTRIGEPDYPGQDFEITQASDGVIKIVSGDYKYRLNGNFTVDNGEIDTGKVTKITFLYDNVAQFEITDVSLGNNKLFELLDLANDPNDSAFPLLFSGKDLFQGGGKNDYIATFGSNDRVFGEGGSDLIFTGGGRDKVWAGAGGDEVFAGAGDDSIYGGRGNDYLDGGRGKDTINGGSGSDSLEGDFGGDILYGGADADVVDGDDGNDRLFGGDGRDLIEGDEDNDVLFGGRGADVFNFDFFDGNNKIKDFGRGADMLEFDNIPFDAGYDSRDFVNDFSRKANGHTFIEVGELVVRLDNFQVSKAELADLIILTDLG